MVKRLARSAASAAPSRELKILRWVLVVLLILYIVGVVPSFNEGVVALFRNPVIKVLLLGFIVIVSYMDHVLGILLGIAYISSVLMAPPQKPTPILAEIRKALQELPLPQVPALVKPAVAQEQKEAMSNPQQQQPPSISQEFARQQRQELDLSNQSQDCLKLPPPSTGCDPIVGYNANYDCIVKKDGKDCLCDGVATWDNELNAQGLNFPMGHSDDQVGANF
jgi:hypothetical protein